MTWLGSLYLNVDRARAFSGKVDTGFPQKMRPLDKTRVLSGSLEPESTLELSLMDTELGVSTKLDHPE
jgi:hypothetical protein